MRILRHKISAGILFFILYAPFIYSICLQAEKQWHQHQQDISAAEHTMIHIEISVDDFHWERKHKEILLNGKYFDVKDYQIRNNIAYIVGHFDEKESFITYTLHCIQHKTNDDENPFAVQELQWFGIFTSIPAKPILSIEAALFISNTFFSEPPLFIKPLFKDVAGIPPWS